MSTCIKWFVRAWCLLAVSGIALRLLGSANYLPLRSFGWVLASLALLVVLASVAWERYRRQKEGYFVNTRGGGEDGSVTYNEAGKTLELYFRRGQRLIYVPTDRKWKDIMPSWAGERKPEIMTRIKSQLDQVWFGRGWGYEETENRDLLMSQSQQTKGQ